MSIVPVLRNTGIDETTYRKLKLINEVLNYAKTLKKTKLGEEWYKEKSLGVQGQALQLGEPVFNPKSALNQLCDFG